jgi:hypothetical protein
MFCIVTVPVGAIIGGVFTGSVMFLASKRGSIRDAATSAIEAESDLD